MNCAEIGIVCLGKEGSEPKTESTRRGDGLFHKRKTISVGPRFTSTTVSGGLIVSHEATVMSLLC